MPDVVEEEEGINLVNKNRRFADGGRQLQMHQSELGQISRSRCVQVVFTAFHRQFGVVVRRTVFGETVAVVQFEVLEKSRFGNLLPVGLVVPPQHRQPRQFFLRLPRHQGTEQENGKEESDASTAHVYCMCLK